MPKLLSQIVELKQTQAGQNGTILFLLLLFSIAFESVAFARGAKINVGLYPFGGYGVLQSSAIDAMNARLGNSPRYKQPYQFGLHPNIGAAMTIWTDKRRFAYGLSAWSLTSSLPGSSSFEGVEGLATLGLTGVDFSFQVRALPWKIRRNARRIAFAQRFQTYAGFDVGYAEVTHTNAVLDPESEIDVSYFYSSQRVAAGARLGVHFLAADWITLVLFDGRIKNMSEISSSLGSEQYTVNGREELALAKSALPAEFAADIVLMQILFGVEIFL